MITAEKIEYIKTMIKSNIDSIINENNTVTVWDNNNEKITYDINAFDKNHIEIKMKDGIKVIETELVKVNA